ncbi:MAG TPA: TonB-dependent receptor [Rhizomicrobium sp.]|jgi:outer membrane receptor for ferrienterochelin and colicins|nr:TonB-dependent receptor [Rhizomicrobium sp.]
MRRFNVGRASALFAVGAAILFFPAPLAAQEKGEAAEQSGDVESVTVTATRSGKRVQDEPIHVEVIDQEEIEEGTIMSPGGIARLLSETSGVHFQVNSAALGAANLTIEGLRGHYTQLFSDGLPLYGGQLESLGLLQIPPADLEHVEIVKGVASALYGPSALGGVINLVSRRPEKELTPELIVNATSVDGQDAVGYLSGPLTGEWGFTLLGSLNRQGESDINHDGWSDLPGFNRALLRPRLFWQGDDGDSVLVTGGFSEEGRSGGTLAGKTLPDGSTFPEKLDTERWDLGTVSQFRLDQIGILAFRASVMGEDDFHRWGGVTDDDHHGTAFGELSLTGNLPSQVWTLGSAVQQDSYRSRNFAPFDYTYTVPALFAQDEYSPAGWLDLAASLRADFHNVFGNFVSPRLSALIRADEWTFRATAGGGVYAPTPFTEDIADTGFTKILPFHAIKAETAQAASFDAGRSFGPIAFNASLFASSIKRPVALTLSPAAPGKLTFVNVSGPTRTIGAELLATYKNGPLTVTGGYVVIHATEIDPQTLQREDAELVPRQTAGISGVWEEEWGKIGLESFFTGRQSLNDPLDPNPYRQVSAPYVIFGALAEWNVTDKLSLFLNSENLTDVRQTRYDPLLRPQPGPDGRRTVDVWAPLDGRLINGGLRARL